MNKAPLTIHDHGNAIMLSESIERMAQGLREAFLDHGLHADDTRRAFPLCRAEHDCLRC